jgi:hypothetical protein
MPKLIVANDNQHWSVERPVLLAVIKDIARLTQISPQTPINFFGPEGKRQQQSSTMLDVGLPDNNWAYNEQITVEVSEDYDVDSVLATALARPEHMPIFMDDQINVYIKPIYALTKETITFVYRGSDKNQVERWRSNMLMQMSAMFTVNLHEVEYDYHLNERLLELIMEVWRLRENIEGYGQSAAEYFTSNLTPRAHLISSQNGETKVWAVKEKQVEVQGYFDFEKVPEKSERVGEHDAWSVSFSYIFEYRKPIGCFAQYPLAVHNQMINEDFITEKKTYDLANVKTRYSLSGMAFLPFRSDVRNAIAYGHEGMNIPDFDDWRPNAVIPTTVKIFTAQVHITPEDKRTLLSLLDLGDITIHQEVVNFLKASEYALLNKRYASIFQMSVYEGANEMLQGDFEVTPELTIRATRDLSLRRLYHVRFSLVTDIRYLTSKTIDRIQANPVVGKRIADAIDASIFGFSGNRPDIAKQCLSDDDYTLLTSTTLPSSYRRMHKPHFVTQFVAIMNVHYNTIP